MNLSEAVGLTNVRLPALTRRRRAVDRTITIDDLRREARRVLPRGVFDFVDGGAGDELTLARNRQAYESIEFVPSVLPGVAEADTTTTLVGTRSELPIALAPTGFQGVVHPGGEVAAAGGASRAGVPYSLSQYATRSVEEVARVAGSGLWFQAYLWRDAQVTLGLIDRAKQQGAEALLVTVDTTTYAQRTRDLRNGFTMPPQLTPSTALEMLRHPRWCRAILMGDPIVFAHLLDSDQSRRDTFAYALGQHKTDASWADLELIRGHWDGPLIVKGLLSTADVARARSIGADGAVLSNHGGRQLDRSVSPIQVLPEARRVVGDDFVLLVDSGIRRGADVAVALALGADGCLVGRAFLYGLAVAGEEGVALAIDILGSELRRTMTMLGASDLAALRSMGSSVLRRVPAAASILEASDHDGQLLA